MRPIEIDASGTDIVIINVINTLLEASTREDFT